MERNLLQEEPEEQAEVEAVCFPEEVAGHFREVAVVAVRQSCVLPKNSVGAGAPMGKR